MINIILLFFRSLIFLLSIIPSYFYELFFPGFFDHLLISMSVFSPGLLDYLLIPMSSFRGILLLFTYFNELCFPGFLDHLLSHHFFYCLLLAEELSFRINTISFYVTGICVVGHRYLVKMSPK